MSTFGERDRMSEEQLKNALREAAYELRDLLTHMRGKMGEEKVFEIVGGINTRTLWGAGYVLVQTSKIPKP